MEEARTGAIMPPMPPATLLWRRDTSRSNRTWSYWVAGGLAALCAFGVFAAFMADDPDSLITIAGLGTIGVVLFLAIPPVFDAGRRRNPEVHLEAGCLKWAKVEVPLVAVNRWSASIQTSFISNGRTSMHFKAGMVQFELNDGTKPTFTFPHLESDELDQLRDALSRVLPVRET